MLRRLLIGFGMVSPSVVVSGSTINAAPPPTKREFAIVQNFTRMNVDICNALGIDPTKVQGVTLSLRPHQAALVTVEHILTNDQVRAAGEAVKKYKLVPDDESAT